MNALLDALHRQRRTLEALLVEGGVRAQDAEAFLGDVLAGISPAGHAEGVELELLLRVDLACAEHAALRGRPYHGLKSRRVLDLPRPRPKAKRRKKRRP